MQGRPLFSPVLLAGSLLLAPVLAEARGKAWIIRPTWVCLTLERFLHAQTAISQGDEDMLERLRCVRMPEGEEVQFITYLRRENAAIVSVFRRNMNAPVTVYVKGDDVVGGD